MWFKKTILKCLNRLNSTNDINEYSTRGEKNGRKRKKNPEESTEQLKYTNNKHFSWVAAVRVLSLAGSHSPSRLLWMPSNIALVSGPAVGAAQTLIWSDSCVFVPWMSTAVRTSMFSLWELSMSFYISTDTESA